MFLLGLQKKIMSNITFIMIKPDAVERGLIGNILKDINDAGFNIRALKLTKLSIDAVSYTHLTLPTKA